MPQGGHVRQAAAPGRLPGGKQPETRQPNRPRLERQARRLHRGALGLPGPGCHHMGMAVIFELVVNFATDKEAAGAAAGFVRRAGHVDVRGVGGG